MVKPIAVTTAYMKRKKMLGPMSIRLDPDVKAALEAVAQAEDRSVAYVINRVLREHFAPLDESAVKTTRARKTRRSRE